MTVYSGDDPDQFRIALASILDQTRPADQVVLVTDGPVTPAIEDIIDAACRDHAEIERVGLQDNVGLIGALNAGLAHCTGDLLFRMDADDVSLPGRIETQTAFMEQHPEIGVLGTFTEEFSQDPEKPERIKRVPVDHESILRSLPFRNPINHPTVCLRRDIVPAAGYPALRFVEDYLLWAQLAARGVRFHNLETPLVRYRFDDATVSRRSGWQNFRSEMALRRWMVRHDLLSVPGFVGIGLVQFVVRFSPRVIQRGLWRLTRQQN